MIIKKRERKRKILRNFSNAAIAQHSNLHKALHDENEIDIGEINNEKEKLLQKDDINNTNTIK